MFATLMAMKIIFRKIGTAIRLTASPDGLRKTVAQLKKNLRRVYIKAHKRPFVYTARNKTRFVCISRSETSCRLYESHDDYEEIEIEICRRWLRPADACLDIGANIGFVSASFASRVGPQGVVVSVEPAPSTLEFLRQAVELLRLDSVRIEAVCVAEKMGRVPFMVASNGGSDVEASMKVGARKADQFVPIVVDAVTVDSLIEKNAIGERISAVKIDIEGAEPMALRGATKLFDRNLLPLVIVEVHRAALANFGFAPMDVLRFFPTDSFEFFHVQRSRTDLTPRFEYGHLYALPDPAMHAWPWYTNVVAVPRAGRYSARRATIATLLP
jgi:FkbM family methyltransferase